MRSFYYASVLEFLVNIIHVKTKHRKNNLSLFLSKEDAAEGDDAATPPNVPLTEDPDQVSVPIMPKMTCLFCFHLFLKVISDDSI